MAGWKELVCLSLCILALQFLNCLATVPRRPWPADDQLTSWAASCKPTPPWTGSSEDSQASGFVRKRPHFVIRRSATTKLSKCFPESVTPQRNREMFQCFDACFNDACCKAVDVTSCERSYVPTEGLDFVKVVCAPTSKPILSIKLNSMCRGDRLFLSEDMVLFQ